MNFRYARCMNNKLTDRALRATHRGVRSQVRAHHIKLSDHTVQKFTYLKVRVSTSGNRPVVGFQTVERPLKWGEKILGRPREVPVF